METVEILKIIEQKVKEHETQMAACQINLDAIQTSLTDKNKPDIKVLGKLAILKDKMIFHKACKMALEDVLKEIK